MGDSRPRTSQPAWVAANGRRFATFAAAALVFIIDPATRRFLLLSSPAKRGRPGWEIVNGGVEAGESPIQAAIREVAEEAGDTVRHRILGTVHAGVWRYDDVVTDMITISFVAAYEGGDVVPGDDMAGSDVCWATIDEVRQLVAHGTALIPQETWLFGRALDCFDLWMSRPPSPELA